MGGELRVAIGVHDTISVALTHKHFIDGSVTKQGDLHVELRGASGEPVLFEGKQVFISDRGARKLMDWRLADRLDSPNIGVYKESLLGNMGDSIMGRKEED